MTHDLTGMSKFIALVLRHKPETIGLQLDDNGWVDVDELISCASSYQQAKGFPELTYAILDKIVFTDKKRRYEYSDDGWMIRACQGHSIDVDVGLENQKPPKILYHGTAEKYVESIRKSGLDKRKRAYVHLSRTYEEAEKVGARHGKAIVLTIRAQAMFDTGSEFFLSKNGIWLTDNVPRTYIEFPDEIKAIWGSE